MLNIRRIIEAKGSGAIFTLSEDATLADMVREACRLGVGAILIADAQGRLTGIVTERDILHQCNEAVDFKKVRVSQIMSRHLVSVHPDDDINSAMDLMIKKRIRHLPVVDGTKIEGLITIRDLIYAMRKADEDEMRQFVEYLQASAATSAS